VARRVVGDHVILRRLELHVGVAQAAKNQVATDVADLRADGLREVTP
jgi:hypothetical protein